MTDKDLVTRLSRYRPAGPPPELKARILRSANAEDRTGLPVWLALGSLAACAVLFFGAASRVYAVTLRHDTDALSGQRSAQVEATARSLGGGSLGYEQALDAAMLVERELATDATGRVALR